MDKGYFIDFRKYIYKVDPNNQLSAKKEICILNKWGQSLFSRKMHGKRKSSVDELDNVRAILHKYDVQFDWSKLINN